MTIRKQKTTVFLCVEGENEKIIIKHIKSNFARGNTYTTVDSTYGGTPDCIAEQAIKKLNSIDPNLKAIWFDNDQKLSNKLESELLRKDFIVIRSMHCLENELLALIPEEKGFKKNESKKCKKYFQKKYTNNRGTISKKICNKLIPKKILLQNQKTKSSKALSILTKIISNTHKN